jgi:hypothetical protein
MEEDIGRMLTNSGEIRKLNKVLIGKPHNGIAA